jgi:hypothetical protein
MDPGKKEWSDQRAHHLYSLATSSKDRKIRQEAVHFLGALMRAGCDDAAWAMKTLRKRTRGDEGGPSG